MYLRLSWKHSHLAAHTFMWAHFSFDCYHIMRKWSILRRPKDILCKEVQRHCEFNSILFIWCLLHQKCLPEKQQGWEKLPVNRMKPWSGPGPPWGANPGEIAAVNILLFHKKCLNPCLGPQLDWLFAVFLFSPQSGENLHLSAGSVLFLKRSVNHWEIFLMCIIWRSSGSAHVTPSLLRAT